MGALRNIWRQRKLIEHLAWNDFKRRYAGSYLGIVWALVHPIVTVVMYWIVFDRIMGVGGSVRGEMSGTEVPYALFLTGGLVPWFFIQEALMNGTTSLLEYSYLVKKVLFDISVLPLVRVIGACFIHVFFTVILLVLGMLYGYMPGLYTIQLLYYFICSFALVLALCYITGAVVVFFRDLTQIIAIALQLLQWATPILWGAGKLTGKLRYFVLLNPLSYLVEGYRASVYGHVWFWEKPLQTLWFWAFTLIIALLGRNVFKRCRPSFADVL